MTVFSSTGAKTVPLGSSNRRPVSASISSRMVSFISQSIMDSMAFLASTLSFYKRQLFVTPHTIDINRYSLEGQIGIITGSNVGLGFEASRHCLRLGPQQLVLAVRSIERGEAAKRALLSEFPKTQVFVWQLDMASYDSIVSFVDRCRSLPRLDFVILNAGVVDLQFARNALTNHEETIQINVLSTCLLTLLLLPVMRNPSGPGKITIVGSEVADWASFPQRFEDPMLPSFDDENNFEGLERYYVSKLLLELFVKEIGNRVDPDKVVVNIANPGLCYGSSLHRGIPGLLGFIFGAYKRAIGRTCEVGSRPIVNAAVVQGKSSHGQYFSDNSIAPMAPLASGTIGDELAARFWREMMNEFPFADAEDIVYGMGRIKD